MKHLCCRVGLHHWSPPVFSEGVWSSDYIERVQCYRPGCYIIRETEYEQGRKVDRQFFAQDHNC